MSAVSLDEIKDHLNLTNDTSAAELAAVLDAAEAVVARQVGPLEPTTFTSIVDTAGGTLTVPRVPVISVTSVTSVYGNGFAYAASDLILNGQTGVLSPGINFGYFGTGYGLLAGRYSVTYVAGRAADDLPADLVMAVKEMVRHLWSTQRGGARRPGSTADDTAPPGYLIPNRVAELLGPHKTFGFGLV